MTFCKAPQTSVEDCCGHRQRFSLSSQCRANLPYLLLLCQDGLAAECPPGEEDRERLGASDRPGLAGQSLRLGEDASRRCATWCTPCSSSAMMSLWLSSPCCCSCCGCRAGAPLTAEEMGAGLPGGPTARSVYTLRMGRTGLAATLLLLLCMSHCAVRASAKPGCCKGGTCSGGSWAWLTWNEP